MPNSFKEEKQSFFSSPHPNNKNIDLNYLKIKDLNSNSPSPNKEDLYYQTSGLLKTRSKIFNFLNIFQIDQNDNSFQEEPAEKHNSSEVKEIENVFAEVNLMTNENHKIIQESYILQEGVQVNCKNKQIMCKMVKNEEILLLNEKIVELEKSYLKLKENYMDEINV